jgi:hypothetical protein
MPTLVSSGQFTIVDNNDARTITSVLTTSGGTQQVFTKDESTVSFSPSWVTTNLTLSPKLYVSGLSEAMVWGSLTNKQFSLTQGGTALTTASTSSSFVDNSNAAVSAPFTVTHGANGTSTLSTLAVKANLLDTTTSFVIFFEADYIDSVTTLTSHIITQVTLSTVKTGTNAVFIVIRGQTNIEQATGATKNNICVAADLIRSSGVDTTALTYRWYESNASGAQINTSTANYITKYGFKNTSSGTNPVAAVGDLNVNVPVGTAGNTHATVPVNTMTLSESAVNKIGIYRVDITDSDSKTYSQYFTIYDISDPYTVRINSSTGDKLQNGIGNTSISPTVFYGAGQVTDLTGWSFTWRIYDKSGKRGAFVDTAKISTAGGAAISANTTGSSATITYGGTSYAFAAGDVVKVVNATGAASFYEVASSVTNVVTIRVAPSGGQTANAWLLTSDFPAPVTLNELNGGKLYGCISVAGAGTRVTAAGASFTLTGDEIDAKASIFCDANRP